MTGGLASVILTPYRRALSVWGGTHHKKRLFREAAAVCRIRQGRTPIIKNISVRDASGNEYTPTYEKRATGLVKHGRAHWIDDQTIELARPPEYETEDIIMDTNIKETDTRFTENAAAEAVREERRRLDEAARQAERDAERGREVTTRDILDYTMGLMAQTDVIERIIEAVKTMPLNETLNGGQGDEARGNALKALAEGYSQNLRYALLIGEHMYKSVHPEA
ncbi:MAG: hypothetical protein VB111_07205 [Clostridiaceae bacterium]|nr:hypothetical protein [Clostridiaceae bacterium]